MFTPTLLPATAQKFGQEALLVWMTAHSICDSKFDGPYLDATKRWYQDREPLIGSCFEHNKFQALSLADLDSGKGNWSEQLHAACRHLVFLDEGVQYLNRRVMDVLRARGDVKVVDGEVRITAWGHSRG